LKLLLDEMYAPDIASALSERGRDVASASERDDLRSAADVVIFEAMQSEARVIVTNNVRDFIPLAQRALQSGSTFYGLVFTSDKSLPRSKANIGTFVSLLEALLAAHVADGELPAKIEWLTPAKLSGERA
jgi:predicted nuclease of predicted toxin-antitoxin system